MAAISHPVPGYPTPRGGEFGAPRSVLNGSIHKGLDFAAPAGIPVRAAARGIVTRSLSSLSPISLANGAGNHIHVVHTDRLETRYVHLLAKYVREGQPVEAGQVIGAVGSSGKATGNHLHFEVLADGVHVDPAPYVGLAPSPYVAGGGSTLAGASGKDYGPIYPLLETEVAAWAASATNANPCAPGYRLGGVDPRLNYVFDNPVGSGPKGAHWVQSPLLWQHPDWAAKGGASAVEGDGRRFACVRSDIDEGEVNKQQFVRFVLPALLEPALNIAIVAGAALLIYRGVITVIKP